MTTSFSLDLLGRIQEVNDHNGNRVKHEYDAAGNRVSIQYPDDSIAKYHYDGANRLSNVIDASGNATEYHYDSAGKLAKHVKPDGSVECFEYDATGFVSGVFDRNGTRVKAYGYDAHGNITEEITFGVGEPEKLSYSYDALNRLAGVRKNSNDYEKNYEYDGIGNLVREINGDNVVQYSYNSRNQLVEKIAASNEKHIYTYDKRGNLVLEEKAAIGLAASELVTREGLAVRTPTAAITENEMPRMIGAEIQSKVSELNPDQPTRSTEAGRAAIASYQYDSTNKLINGTNADGLNTNYTYDGFGYLASKTEPDTKTYVQNYLKEISAPLTEGNIKYVYGIARISQTSDNDTLIYHNDRLGSAEKLTDMAGNIVAQVAYDEWGAPSVIQPGLNPNYTGHEYDHTLGVYYAKERFYDPAILRVLSPDPHWDPDNSIYGDSSESKPDIHAIRQSSNLYAYCGNNPIMHIDPLGLVHVIFYCAKDFSNQAQWMRRQLGGRELGGHLNVYMVRLEDAEEFVARWNRITESANNNPNSLFNPYHRTGGIQDMHVFAHGHERSITFGEDGSGISIDGWSRAAHRRYSNPDNTHNHHPGMPPIPGGVVMPSVNDLYTLNNISGYVRLYSCNPGHLNAYMNEPYGNFASALSTRVNGGGGVTGYDGTVGFGTNNTRRFPRPRRDVTLPSPIGNRLPGGNWEPRLSNDQEDFHDIVEYYGGSPRQPHGELLYVNGELAPGQIA